ncbi:histone-lysine N-methyltransferase SETMAR [Pelomyxa schiedti]|nr:histone-lysine N-methyltransferase SETMAR [Pelomyxa schiedti]
MDGNMHATSTSTTRHGCPSDFEWIERCTRPRGEAAAKGGGGRGRGSEEEEEPMWEGCQCVGDRECFSVPCICDCVERSGGTPYDPATGLVKEERLGVHSLPIYECSSLCSCNCANRVVQRGRAPPLQCFMTEHKGWGVRTLQSLPKGQFVTEYCGEIISSVEAKSRREARAINTPEAPTFLLTTREIIETPQGNNKVLTLNIDSTTQGNIARFFNHSCEPNLSLLLVRTTSLLPQVAFFTSRAVVTGEELCWNYGGGGTGVQAPEYCGSLPKKICNCGSVHCLGYIPFM